MITHPSLEKLWDSAPRGDGSLFSPDPTLPEPARRYLAHTIATGTPLASAVRLQMHGEFRLKGRWYPFTAEQVIRRDGEMLWRATIRMGWLSIKGFDRVLEGQGVMQWKLLGLFPFITASGPDITRSALGRVLGESVCLPTMLCGDLVAWSSSDPSHANTRLSLRGEQTELALSIAASGGLESYQYQRWGNPGGGGAAAFGYCIFGGSVEAEGTFGGYTIPTRMRIGWHFGTDRFLSEGEFFRVTITNATFR